MDQSLSPTSDNPVFRCAYGDMFRFGTLTVQKKHNCTHGEFCGVQEKNKRYLKNVDLMTHMWQKYAANIGKTELTYKPPIDTEDEELDSKEEEEMNDQPRHSFFINSNRLFLFYYR